MKYVYLAMNWIFGVLFLFTGLVSIIESPLGGLSLVLISLLLLPPIRNFSYSKIGKELPGKARIVAILVLFITFGVFVAQTEDRKAYELAVEKARVKAEKSAVLRQHNINYFNRNSSKILDEVRTVFNNGNYKKVIALSSKYLPSRNQDLIDINLKANSELAAIEKAQKEAKEKAKREAEIKAIRERYYRKKRAELTLKTQKSLQEIGFDPGPIDGIYGSRTKSAILKFQAEHQLEEDGKISKSLLEHIEKAAQVPSIIKDIEKAAQVPSKVSTLSVQKTTKNLSSILKPGIYTMKTQGLKFLIADSANSWNKYLDYSLENDSMGVLLMLSSGELFAVWDGTKVQFLDYFGGFFSGGTTVKIRILEGEYLGMLGYTLSSNLY